MQDRADDEILLFDGETTLLSLSLRYGLTDRLAVGIELPYVLQESGGLDALVDQWHDWFGFPDGLRGLVAEDRLDYRYADDGQLLVDFDRNRRGLGDLRIGAAWQLGHSERSAMALQAEVKLPTGKSGRLTGSGAADLSIGIAGDHARLFGSERIDGYYRAHLTAVGEPDRLAARAEPLIGTVTAGMRARIARPLELALQATLRSAAYDSAVEPLGATAVLLNVGGTIRLGERLRLAVSVGEDVAVDTAPDVTLGLSLYYAPAD